MALINNEQPRRNTVRYILYSACLIIFYKICIKIMMFWPCCNVTMMFLTNCVGELCQTHVKEWQNYTDPGPHTHTHTNTLGKCAAKFLSKATCVTKKCSDNVLQFYSVCCAAVANMSWFVRWSYEVILRLFIMVKVYYNSIINCLQYIAIIIGPFVRLV